MKPREEWFVQTHGAAQVELRGGPLELALFVGGKPLVYDAADCEGSVGRFTALLPEPPSLPMVQAVELNALNGFESETSLSQQIVPLLALLPDGQYRLALTQTAGCYHLDWDVTPCKEDLDLSRGYYPLGQHYERVKWLVPTQLDDQLKDERLNFYLNKIDGGARPALITIGHKDHDAWFILDGHHKLMASYCCGVQLPTLLIEFQALSAIPVENARSILRGVAYTAGDYLRWKSQCESAASGS